VDAFGQALKTLGITCPYFITQNDGTLMSADFAKSYPVLTFASGPTNSMRGASFLTGEQNAIVVDVGGTSTDVGALIKGFPRPASTSVDVGGVRTNFRMPDVYSIALGGGSIINKSQDIKVGPKSVGFNIHQESMIFGGSTTTATDIAVGLGIVDIGNPDPAKALGNDLLVSVKDKIDEMIINAVERMRVSSEKIPVLAVGGGSILIPEKVGDLPVVKPENFAVANAVGAAIGQISGEVDRIFSLSDKSRDEVLEEAKDEATKKAILLEQPLTQ
jgi:N-methylhydantoinase A/acetone carboxylase, beta subunit